MIDQKWRHSRNVDFTSNGNMVSPPSSKSVKYTKKEATCVIVSIATIIVVGKLEISN